MDNYKTEELFIFEKDMNLRENERFDAQTKARAAEMRLLYE